MTGRGFGRTIMTLAAAGVLSMTAPAAGAAGPWPSGLEGPFELDRVERVAVRSHDGTVLRGFAQIPRLPAGVGAPVVLFSSPYDGTVDPAMEDPAYESLPSGRPATVPVARLIREGYAVVNVNVRGTGDSGGCFELFGDREQRDQKLLVDWAASREWSNGNVAMMGLSYDGTTPLEAAVQRPRGLKAIVISGVSSDIYTTFLSPQGSPYEDQWHGLGAWYAPMEVGPRRHAPQNAAQGMIDHLGVAPDRICPEVVRWMSESETAFLSDRRDAEFYEERNFMPRLKKVRAAVLLAHGLQDQLTFSEDWIFARLTRAPRTYIAGQWSHALPSESDLPGFQDRMFEWYDHFLKGIGREPAAVGRVEYEDDTGTWRSSRAWPPAEVVEEKMPLARGTFLAAPDRSQASATADPRSFREANAPPCPEADSPTTLLTESAPLPAETLIAGNPTAVLRLESDKPAGRFSLRLFELEPQFDCAAGAATGYRFLTEGAVDLRFHRDRYTAAPFQTGRPVTVRVDLANLAERLLPGSRVLAVLGFGPQKTGVGTRAFPRLTVHDGEVVLPVVPQTANQ